MSAIDALLEAESTLDGEALIDAQVVYLRTDEGWFPGETHDEGECVVCDARREAIRRYDAEDNSLSSQEDKQR